MKTGCAILAGGKATRFGGVSKPEIIIEGRKVIDRILDVVTPLFDEIIIVTGNRNLITEERNILITSDLFKLKGPLAGIHAALKMSQSDALFIVAGDMPYLERNVIENLTFQFNKLIPQALVPRHSGFIEPLHSIYNAEIEPLLVKMLTTSDNASVISLLEQIDTRYLDVEPSVAVRAFHNINSSDDLRRI